MDTPYTDDSKSILKELGLEQDSSDQELEPEVVGDNSNEEMMMMMMMMMMHPQ